MQKIVVLALASIAVVPANAPAQSEPQLVGPVRDVARTEIVYPVVLDPLLDLPLTPNLQAAIEARGADVTGAVRAGVQFGDISYGFVAGGPINRGGKTDFVDRRRIPVASFGFDMTHIVWHPKARPSLTRQLGAAGFLTSPSGETLGPAAPGTAPVGLSRESQQAVARAIDTADAIDLPWVLFLSAGFKFGSKEYTYTDSHTRLPTSATHLSDVAQMLIGAQFLVRGDDPGYFAAFSFNYSTLFHDADGKIGPPDMLHGTALRLDVRRPFVDAHLGINSSLTYELDTKVKTIEAATYGWFSPHDTSQRRNALKLTAGVRVGYQSGRGGAFASVFAGPVFGTRP